MYQCICNYKNIDFYVEFAKIKILFSGGGVMGVVLVVGVTH